MKLNHSKVSVQSRLTLNLYRDALLHICDVVYEKGPYCGTNIRGPDQTPRMMRGV